MTNNQEIVESLRRLAGQNIPSEQLKRKADDIYCKTETPAHLREIAASLWKCDEDSLTEFRNLVSPQEEELLRYSLEAAYWRYHIESLDDESQSSDDRQKQFLRKFWPNFAH